MQLFGLFLKQFALFWTLFKQDKKFAINKTVFGIKLSRWELDIEFVHQRIYFKTNHLENINLYIGNFH